MTLLSSVQNYSTKPFDSAFTTAIENKEATCGQSVQARALFVTQLIISIVALPIILLIGLISLAVRATQGEGKEAAEELWMCLKEHLAVTIPTSLVGIFAPLNATKDAGIALINCALLSQEQRDAIEDLSANDNVRAMKQVVHTLTPEAKGALKLTLENLARGVAQDAFASQRAFFTNMIEEALA